MNIPPAEFAHYLKNSSLTAAEQSSVLDLLPRLSEGQVSDLFRQLREDTHQINIVSEQAGLQRDQIVQDFGNDLESAKAL